MNDTERPSGRRDLILYSVFVYALGVFSGLIAAFGTAPWSVWFAMGFMALVTAGGFFTIDDSLRGGRGTGNEHSSTTTRN